MHGDRATAGFTLVEVLVALGIVAVVMTLLWSTFATSAATVRVVEERADELASLAGAVDTLSHEIRGAYESLSGTKSTVTFTAMTPFVHDVPVVQVVSYEFEQGRLTRKVDRRSFVLLAEVGDPSFAFWNGTAWVDQWRDPQRLPAGIRVTFSHKGKAVDTVIPIWSTP